MVAGFVSLGLWQWNKYAVKTERQSERDRRSRDALIAMPRRPASADFLRYRHVELSGEFEPARQILIDNRVEPVTERAGYIGRIRALSRLVATAYVASREAAGYPMLAERDRASLPAQYAKADA